MAQPTVYDLSYRTNIGGLFIPYEYITNFVAGEAMELDRRVINTVKQVVGVVFMLKSSKAGLVLLVKSVSSIFTGDGHLTLETNGAAIKLDFRVDETVLMEERRYFTIEAVFDDGSTMLLSQGFIQGSLQQGVSSGLAVDIVILNLPGEAHVGQFQINAIAVDTSGSVVDGVPIDFYSSNNAVATINDTGLIVAKTLGTVVITAATKFGNIAKRATLVIT